MLFYLFFAIAMVSILWLGHNQPTDAMRKIYWQLSCWCLAMFAILRFDVGYDYSAYWNLAVPDSDSLSWSLLFNSDPSETIYWAFERLEPLNRFLFWSAYQFNSPWLVFLFYGLATYLLLFVTMRKYSANCFIAMLVYFGLYFINSWGGIRQTLAGAVIFFSYRYMRDKKLLAFFVCILIAGLLHQSAFFCLPMYFIYNYVPLSVSFFGLIFTLPLGIVLLPQIIAISGYAHYFTLDLNYEGGRKIQILNCLLWVLCWWLFRQATHQTDKQTASPAPLPPKQYGAYAIPSAEVSKLLVICLVGSLLPFLLGSFLGGRFSRYFLYFFILLVPAVFQYYYTRISTAFIVIASLVTFMIFIYLGGQMELKNPYVPYRCILFTDTSITQ